MDRSAPIEMKADVRKIAPETKVAPNSVKLNTNN